MTAPINFVVYKNATGEIVRRGQCHPDAVLPQAVGADETSMQTTVLEDAKTRYVDNGSVVDRPVNSSVADKTEIAADGVEILTITNIPVGTEVTVLGPVESTTTVDDGELGITAAIPGSYRVRLDAFPIQHKEITFVAT